MGELGGGRRPDDRAGFRQQLLETSLEDGGLSSGHRGSEYGRNERDCADWGSTRSGLRGKRSGFISRRESRCGCCCNRSSRKSEWERLTIYWISVVQSCG